MSPINAFSPLSHTKQCCRLQAAIKSSFRCENKEHVAVQREPFFYSGSSINHV